MCLMFVCLLGVVPTFCVSFILQGFNNQQICADYVAQPIDYIDRHLVLIFTLKSRPAHAVGCRLSLPPASVSALYSQQQFNRCM